MRSRPPGRTFAGSGSRSTSPRWATAVAHGFLATRSLRWWPTGSQSHPPSAGRSPSGSLRWRFPPASCPRASTSATGRSTPLAEHKEATEAHLYSELCNLANLDLRLVCYDLTSSYFETVAVGRRAFPSLAFGYSRDHRGDRPQIMIGLLVTSDGIPIAHHVFSGNTADVSTLPGVMEDLKSRFGVGRIALVADRGLISEDNLALVAAHGFDHVLATRLHHDDDVAAVLELANAPTTSWEAVPEARSFCAESHP